MATTSDFRNGLCLEYNHDIYTIVKFQHVKPGKGAAFVRTKLKSITTGKVIENTFNAGVKITTARIEKRPHNFLYKDDLGYHFMDTNTFEQIVIQEAQTPSPQFLSDGLEVDVLVHAEKENLLRVELPQFIEAKVTYTGPGLKGDTVSNVLKPAEIETGAKVMVPLFINQGEKIKVDTRTGEYYERVK